MQGKEIWTKKKKHQLVAILLKREEQKLYHMLALLMDELFVIQILRLKQMIPFNSTLSQNKLKSLLNLKWVI